MKVESESEVAQSCLTLSDPMDCMQPTRLLHPRDFPGNSIGVGCHCLLIMSKLNISGHLFIQSSTIQKMSRDYFKNNRKILRFKTIVLVSNDIFNLERQICKYTATLNSKIFSKRSFEFYVVEAEVQNFNLNEGETVTIFLRWRLCKILK